MEHPDTSSKLGSGESTWSSVFSVFALIFMFPTCSIKYVRCTVSLQVIGVHEGSTFCTDVVAAHVAFIAGLQNT
jgi:hypothetical protein